MNQPRHHWITRIVLGPPVRCGSAKKQRRDGRWRERAWGWLFAWPLPTKPVKWSAAVLNRFDLINAAVLIFDPNVA